MPFYIYEYFCIPVTSSVKLSFHFKTLPNIINKISKTEIVEINNLYDPKNLFLACSLNSVMSFMFFKYPIANLEKLQITLNSCLVYSIYSSPNPQSQVHVEFIYKLFNEKLAPSYEYDDSNLIENEIISAFARTVSDLKICNFTFFLNLHKLILYIFPNFGLVQGEYLNIEKINKIIKDCKISSLVMFFYPLLQSGNKTINLDNFIPDLKFKDLSQFSIEGYDYNLNHLDIFIENNHNLKEININLPKFNSIENLVMIFNKKNKSNLSELEIIMYINQSTIDKLCELLKIMSHLKKFTIFFKNLYKFSSGEIINNEKMEKLAFNLIENENLENFCCNSEIIKNIEKIIKFEIEKCGEKKIKENLEEKLNILCCYNNKTSKNLFCY